SDVCSSDLSPDLPWLRRLGSRSRLNRAQRSPAPYLLGSFPAKPAIFGAGSAGTAVFIGVGCADGSGLRLGRIGSSGVDGGSGWVARWGAVRTLLRTSGRF